MTETIWASLRELEWQTAVALASPFVTLAAVALGAWLASIFARRRFYEERTWDRKAAAFTIIFEGLHDMLRYHDENFEAEIGGRELSAERRATIFAEYQNAKENIRRRIAGETWLLPAEVEDEIDRLWKSLATRRDSYFEALDEGYGAVAATQVQLRTVARIELDLTRKVRKRG